MLERVGCLGGSTTRRERTDCFVHGHYITFLLGKDDSKCIISFADLVTIGERVDEGLKNGTFANIVESSRGARKPSRNFQKRKEGKTNVVSNERRRPRHRQQYYGQLATVSLVINTPLA